MRLRKDRCGCGRVIGIDDAHRRRIKSGSGKIRHKEHGKFVGAVDKLSVFGVVSEAAESDVGRTIFGAVVLAYEKLIDEPFGSEGVETFGEGSAFLVQALVFGERGGRHTVGSSGAASPAWSAASQASP